MAVKNMNDVRNKIKESLIKGNLCFFTGAGMSISPPAYLPLGMQIIDAIVDFLLEKSDLFAYPNIKKWVKGVSSNIPMELLWEVLVRVAGNDILDALSILEGGIPNKDHTAIALFCSKYKIKSIFTLNFDTLHEKAISSYTSREARSICTQKDFEEFYNFSDDENIIRVVHLHNILKRGEYSELASTVSKVGTGLPRYKAIPFINSIKSNDIICAGYSNGDIDTFPLLAETQNILYWYHHTGNLPPTVEKYSQQPNNKLEFIERENDEKGFWNVLSGLDREIEQKIHTIGIDDTWDSCVYTQKKRCLINKLKNNLGRTDLEITKACRLAVSILCDELGNRDYAQLILKLNLSQIDKRQNINYAESMLAGHLNERLGNISAAITMFSKAKVSAPTNLNLQEAELEYISAKLGAWKRNPLKVCLLINWLISIRKLSKTKHIKIKQRVYWELGDLSHFIAEFLLIPSSLFIFVTKGKLSIRQTKVALVLDNIAIIIFRKLRKRLFVLAVHYYVKMLKLSMKAAEDEIPGYTSLAFVRLCESLAGSGKLRQAKYALSFLKRGERFYKWVKSEHGKANTTCAKGVVGFYDKNFTEALNNLQNAQNEYGSHYAGILKTMFYIFRVNNWETKSRS
ncbi:MAG: hypothetical protein GX660_07910 [Clostridiaceae bacterium]|nr:hypothetical protein [Clostridiaceae bacterium]